MKLVWKLLRKHISPIQLVGFALANLVGTVVVLLGIQFYSDATPIFTQPDSFMKKEYLVLSKKVSTLGALAGRSTTFSEEEIGRLSRQSFAGSVGAFTPCRFGITASIVLLGQNVDLSTQLFFESVPDIFLDVQTNDWTFDESKGEVPIILPKNYLDLYNYGFAQSRNLPQLSAGVLGLIQIDLSLYGNGLMKKMKGRVVGFSSRLNTILVPESFVRWSNDLLSGDASDRQPSRLIVEVDRPADGAIASYLQDNGYETEGNKLDQGKTSYLLKILVSVVATVGLVIMFLSLFILMLSVYLLLQKNSEKLRILLLLGYSPRRVAASYQLLISGLNILVCLAAILLLLLIRGEYYPLLQQLLPSLSGSSLLVSVLAGVLLCLLFSAVNSWVVYRKVCSLSKE